MEYVKSLNDGVIYEGRATAPQNIGLLWYYFIIETYDGVYYYGNNSNDLGGIGQLKADPCTSYQVTVYSKDFTTPNWFKDAIVYQIFVDRFYNGNENGVIQNCKDKYIIHTDWYDDPNYKPDPETGEILCNDFFGGNLKGVLKKLPYLKELGINTIYLNPIFEAFSNHKYDTGDYMKIDPMFGDNNIFKILCQSAKQMGINIILDGVFSHTGSDSKYFNKKGRYESIGAYNSEKSPYYNWYRFNNFPDDYDCWWGIYTLPNVDEMDPTYQNFIINDGGSVLRYWIRCGSKGWRLDVADELPDQFLKNFRRAVKESDREAVIIGEVWEDASNKISYSTAREYLFGDELDSTMNYPLRDALIKFFTGQKSGEYLHKHIMRLYENYPIHVFYSTLNLIGGHDVARIRTIMGNAPKEHKLSKVEKASYRLSNDEIQLANKRVKMLCMFQMTYPGAPCIYYGDEAGLEGYSDPFNRAAFPWGYEDADLLKWYKKFIHMRLSYDALRTGEFIPIYYNDDIYAFARCIRNGRDVFGQPRQDGFAVAVFNRSRDKWYSLKLDISVYNSEDLKFLFDVLDKYQPVSINGGYLKISIPPLTSKIYVKK